MKKMVKKENFITKKDVFLTVALFSFTF